MKTSTVRYIAVYFRLINFLISGLIINIIQCLLYFGLRPWNKYLYRKINYYLSYTFYSQMVCTAEWLSESELYIYIDKKDLESFGKEHACIVMDHKYEIDWLFIGTFSDKVHVAGNFKAYMKKVVQFVPALGWCLYFSENIFLDRSYDKDKEIIQKQISEIVDFPDPIWIVLFPEGTRYNTRKHEESVKYAQEKGLPILKHHLNPRPKGFLTSLSAFRGKIGALYDVTLSIHPNDEIEPTMLNVLVGKKVKAHFYIKRIPMEEVPTDEQKATKFLNDMFIQKDKLQDSFFNTRDYFAESGVERIQPFKLNKNYLTLLNFLAWQFTITVPSEENSKKQNKIEIFARYFYIYFVFTLTHFISGFIINFIQLVLHLVLKPYNVRLFRQINYYLCYTLYNNALFLVQWNAETDLYLYMDEKDKKYLGKEHAYVILNHKYEIDWLIIGMLAEKCRVAGNYKAYMKKALQYIPAIGWCLYFSENIFLERSFEKDKQTIQNQISKLVQYPDPIWLILYPEGTRFTPEKYETSLKISKEKGLPELKYHLTPRTKGFVTSLPPMKGKMGAIYDVTITFNPKKTQATIQNVFYGRKTEAHIYFRRIPFEEVPEDENGATQFLHDIFVRKDKLQESFLTTGDYFTTSGIEKVAPIKLNKSWKSIVNHVLWVFLIMGTLIYNLIKLLFTGSLYNICLVYGLLFFFSFALSRLFGASQTNKGSTYGTVIKKSK